jgi:hypothetical protein
MKLLPKFSFLIVFSLLMWNCSSQDFDESETNPNTGPNSEEPSNWLIPVNQVFDGGPGKDGIPSIDIPNFSLVNEVDFLSDQDLVMALFINGEIRVYPHPILDWHEIVNDQAGDHKFAITYCPLTGTGVGWNREFEGATTTFGVSGLLYNSNLIPYDRSSNSNWSQLRLDCVNGELIGHRIETYSLLETQWKTIKEAYPGALVLNTNSGFNRNYSTYPYGDYRSNHNRLIFPVNNQDRRLPSKQRVLGLIINDQIKAYPFDLGGDSETEILTDIVGGEKLIVLRNNKELWIQSFLNPRGKQFVPINNSLPVIMEDQDGNQYDLFGSVVNGLITSDHLEIPECFMGYWFSWAAFYPEIDLY